MFTFILVGLLLRSVFVHSIFLPEQIKLPPMPVEDSQERVEYATLEIYDEYYGLRNVSYTVTSNGLAVIDGDVIYGTFDDLLAHDSRLSVPDIISTKSFSVRTAWPGANILYKFDSPATAAVLQSTVSTAISRWKSVASYLTFTEQPDSTTPMNGVVTISTTCSVNGANDCSSSTGFSNSARSMNLCSSGCGADQATHEFGHVLGIFACRIVVHADSSKRPGPRASAS